MSSSAIRAGRAFVELFADDSMLVRTLRRAEAKVVKFGTNIKNIGRKMFMLGLASAAPMGLATKAFANFDDQMRAVKTATGATTKEFEDLTEKAKFLGSTTSFTASQVAGAMLEMGRGGFSAKEIDDSISAILTLSRAAGTELPLAADIASNALCSFNLSTADLTRVCDVLTATATASSSDVTKIGEAMAQAAPIASEYGMTLEQTAKAIGALSKFDIKGSQAGTTLRKILVNFTDSNVQKKLKGLGVSVVDGNTGKLRDVSEVLRDIGKAAQNLPNSRRLAVFKEVFGANALAGGAKLSAAQFDVLIDSIDNAAGACKRAANEMDSGIGGSLRMLWAAAEGITIAIGEALSPALKRITDNFTVLAGGLADYITKNKELVVSVAKTIAVITGIGAALLTAGFIIIGFGKSIGAVATTITSFAKIVLGGLGLIGGVFTAISAAAGGAVSVLSSVFAGLGAVFGTVFSVIAAAGTAVFGVLGAAIAAILPPIGLTVIALAALGGVCYLVGRNFTAIGSAAATVFTNIVSGVRTALASVNGFFNSFRDFRILFTAIQLTGTVLRTLGKTFISLGTNCVLPVVQLIVKGFQLAGQAVISIGGRIVSAVVSVFSGFISILRQAFGGAGAVISGVFVHIYTVINAVFAKSAGIIGGFTAVLRVLSGYITAFARGLFIIEAGVQVFSLLYRSVSGIIGVFTGLSRGIPAVFTSVFQNVPVLLTGIVRCFTAVPGQILAVFSAVPGIIGSVFSSAVGIVQGAASGIGAVFTGVVSTVRSIGSVLSGVFSTAFGFIGGLLTDFGNFFLGVFVNIGTAVDWLREQFGSLCSFAMQTYGAVTAALGRGDIESAVQVIWASIRHIWIKGSVSLLTTWYWLTEALQTAWATAVFKISELLTAAWFGVQSFWTETVYTMSTLWVEFANSVASVWKKAEQSIAQGIGYIIAKMHGLDPNEMSNIISEDYQRQAKQRESDKSKRLNSIQEQRNQKITSLAAEKQGTLDNLQSDFNQNTASRQSVYDAKIAAQEAELTAAKNAYSEAINRAKNPPVVKPEETSSLTDRLKAKADEVIGGFNAKRDLESGISVSGSFSAAAIQSMGFGSSMDRVAKATEKSEKHLEKIAGKNDKKEKPVIKKEEEPKGGDDLAVRELKQQTRYLRDISERGLKFS